jgi:hypothetical protein
MKVQGCQPYAPAAFIPRKYSWYSFQLEADSTPGPLCGRKDYVNEKFQLGIEPATFWFVAQCLNHCATACPRYHHQSSRKLKHLCRTTLKLHCYSVFVYHILTFTYTVCCLNLYRKTCKVSKLKF